MSYYGETSMDEGRPITVIPRDLSITWGDDQRYWRRYTLNESNTSVEVAELLEVCWLEVNGRFNISYLSPGIVYEVVFTVMLRDSACGWEVPVNLRLELPNGEKQERKECFQDKQKGKWMELYVGDFKIRPGNCGEIKFTIIETQGGKWKKGLIIESASIRPKI